MEGSGTDRNCQCEAGGPDACGYAGPAAGYFYGYHMRRGSWVSILLDGTVSLEEVCRWVDESYAVTAPRRGRNGGSCLKRT